MKNLKPYFIICTAFFTCLALGLSFWGRDDFFLHINALHLPWLDPIMAAFTHWGDGITVVAIIFLILLFVNRRLGFVLGIASLINSVLTQVLKRTVFDDVKRPSAYFKPEDLHQVPWAEFHQNFSFPSGHTSAAFCLYFFIASLRPHNVYWQISMALVACIIAYSRMYVSNHFPSDLLAGGVLGSTVAILTCVAFDKMQWGINWPVQGLLQKKKK